jgi:hypothetical protein
VAARLRRMGAGSALLACQSKAPAENNAGRNLLVFRERVVALHC